MEVNLKFIERLKDFPILYDRTRSHTQVVDERAAIWEELSKEFNFNAKKKYETFRDKYGREKRKEKNMLNAGGKFTSHWKYFKHMSNIIQDRNPQIKDANKIKIERVESFTNKKNTTKDINPFYDDFCAEEMTSQEDQEENTQENNLSMDSIKMEKHDPFHDIFQDEITKTSFKPQNNRTVVEKDEDSVFLELLAIKMKKMSLSEKSDFQLEILRKADHIIIKK